jgi:hypothetical protein
MTILKLQQRRKQKVNSIVLLTAEERERLCRNLSTVNQILYGRLRISNALSCNKCGKPFKVGSQVHIPLRFFKLNKHHRNPLGKISVADMNREKKKKRPMCRECFLRTFV